MKPKLRASLLLVSIGTSALVAASGLAFSRPQAIGAAAVSLGGSSAAISRQQAIRPVTISGRITMGTAGAAVPRGLVVAGAELTDKGKRGDLKQDVSEDGTFLLEGFEGKGDRFLVAVEHQGVTYSRTLRSAEDQIESDLKVFETTEDASVVSVASNTVTVLQGQGDTMEILEVLRMRNASDRTYTGPSGNQPRPVVLLALPEGARELAPAETANPHGLAPTPRGVAATAPLHPGETAISYLYEVRVPRTGFQFRRETIYPTQRTDLLIGPGLELNAAPDLKYQETRKLGDAVYKRYRSEKLQPGALLGADIAYATDTGGGLWAGVAVAFTVLVAGIVASILFGKRRSRSKAAPAIPGGREELIHEIARLDSSFEAGSIPEADYRSRREQMKEKLAELSSR